MRRQWNYHPAISFLKGHIAWQTCQRLDSIISLYLHAPGRQYSCSCMELSSCVSTVKPHRLEGHLSAEGVAVTSQEDVWLTPSIPTLKQRHKLPHSSQFSVTSGAAHHACGLRLLYCARLRDSPPSVWIITERPHARLSNNVRGERDRTYANAFSARGTPVRGESSFSL